MQTMKTKNFRQCKNPVTKLRENLIQKDGILCLQRIEQNLYLSSTPSSVYYVELRLVYTDTCIAIITLYFKTLTVLKEKAN